MTNFPTTEQLQTPAGPFYTTPGVPMGRPMRHPNRAFFGLASNHSGHLQATKTQTSPAGPVVVGGGGGWTLPISGALYPSIIAAGAPIAITVTVTTAAGVVTVTQSSRTFTALELSGGVNLTGACGATDTVTVQVSGVTGGSYLQGFASAGKISPVVAWDYYEDQGWNVTVAPFGLAVVGVSRTDAGNPSAIGLTGSALSNHSGGGTWGAYIDAIRASGTAGNAMGAEINVATMAQSPQGQITPYNIQVAGQLNALRLAGGSDKKSFGISYAIPAGQTFQNNGAPFQTGISFSYNSLLREGEVDDATGIKGLTAGYGMAIAMAHNHGLSWYSQAPSGAPGSGTQAEAFRLSSSVTTAGKRWRMEAAENSFIIGEGEGTAQNNLVVDYVADSATGLRVTPAAVGGGITLAALGFNPNINMLLAGKGTGGVYIAKLIASGWVDAANDTAAASAGVEIGQAYHNSGAMRVRVV